jgi:hypothetical protein
MGVGARAGFLEGFVLVVLWGRWRICSFDLALGNLIEYIFKQILGIDADLMIKIFNRCR